jgi:hypothetical protein
LGSSAEARIRLLPTKHTSGERCARGVGVDAPSIILPSRPGIRAELRSRTVVVERSFE